MRTAPSGDSAGGGPDVLAAVVGSLSCGFSLWGEDRRLRLWNQRYLEMYRLPMERIREGMSLREMCDLTVEVGNHADTSADELHALYQKRLDDTAAPGGLLCTRKPIRGRIIDTGHHRVVGLGWIVTHEDVTEEVEQQWLAELREKTLAEQNTRFDAAISNLSHGLSMYDAEWRLLICNERYRDMYALPPELTRTGTPFRKIIAHRQATGAVHLDIGGDFVEAVITSTRSREPRVETYRLDNGRVVSVHRSPMANGGFVVLHHDITLDIERLEAIKARETELAHQNMRFEAAVENMSQGLCMFDGEERLVICNQRYADIYDLPAALMRPGTTLTAILDSRLEHGIVPKDGHEVYVAQRRALVTSQSFAKDEIAMEDGRIIAVKHHPLADGGWVATHEDITEQRQIEARVRHLARHDALTDLPNRVLLREEMDKLEARIQRGERLAVLCLDLDHFKTVNDTLGHGVGDQVLVTVAQRLREASRETDVLARLGGDEFAMLAHKLQEPGDAAVIAARIVESIARPMRIGPHEVLIGASVGIAMAPGDGTTADALLSNADLALYRAKNDGRGGYHFFEPGMDAAVQRRRMLEQGLRLALARGQFRLVYQPLMDVASNRIGGFEALLRWDHPERGVLLPMEFVPVAEETGVINAIGEWVLQQACRTAAQWPEDVRLAVNLSPVQFKHRRLVDQVAAALADAGLDAGRLELEITESLLLEETDTTLKTLHRLRGLGVRIAMDDFGTGYSSLSYLRAFPFDKIKIDRSFMNDLGPDQDGMAIVRAVIGLGQSLGMATTAEGIETEEQLAAVREQGCAEVQGFLFSPPLPASGTTMLLRRTQPPHGPADATPPAATADGVL